MASKKTGETTQGAPRIDIGISEKDRRKVAGDLAHFLADSYTLYLKTHNFHWNVTGPMFNTLHTMFMTQYTEEWTALDEIAERIRALGSMAPGSYAEFVKLSSIRDGAVARRPGLAGDGPPAGGRQRGRLPHRPQGHQDRGRRRRRSLGGPGHPAPAGAREERLDASLAAGVSGRPDGWFSETAAGKPAAVSASGAGKLSA